MTEENKCKCTCEECGDECNPYYKRLEQEDKQMKSALEEIREIVRADCKGCTAECDCDEDCTRYMIKNKINEVLSNDRN